MTNVMILKSSALAIKGVTETAGGNTYTDAQIDKNILKSFGGSYVLPAYGDDSIARWSAVVIDVTTATALSNGAAFEGNPVVTDGTLPVKVLAIAVEYIKELGTVGPVVITIGTQIFTELSEGEGVIIPISGASGVGIEIAEVKIHAKVYSDGVNEATVNVMLVGLAA